MWESRRILARIQRFTKTRFHKDFWQFQSLCGHLGNNLLSRLKASGEWGAEEELDGRRPQLFLHNSLANFGRLDQTTGTESC
jgi:hypothetical protein